MNDLEISLTWSDDGAPGGLRFTARGWQLHSGADGTSARSFADIGELAHALVERQTRGEEPPTAPSSVSGPGIPMPRPWPSIAAVVAEVGARTPPPLALEGKAGTGPTYVAPAPTVVKNAPILVKKEELLAVITAMLTRPLVLLAGVSGSGLRRPPELDQIRSPELDRPEILIRDSGRLRAAVRLAPGRGGPQGGGWGPTQTATA